MGVKQYRKKPVVIEAIQLTEDSRPDVMAFVPADLSEDGGLTIHTLEGSLHASLNDWIIKGVQGEFYPCKPDIFEATYEEA